MEIKTGVLLKDFAQHLQRQGVADIYFTQLDAVSITPDLVIKSHVKQGWRKRRLNSYQTWLTKVASILHAKVCILRLVRNLAKAAKVSPMKVREFLHSKFSYSRFTQATRNIKKIGAFARSKNEIWCMRLAYVDEVAKTIMA